MVPSYTLYNVLCFTNHLSALHLSSNGSLGASMLIHFADRETEAGTLRSNFPVSKMNSESLSPLMTPLVPCSRSRVPRGTDLSERPGARDLAPGSHRLGALGPPERRSGRVRSAAMAPAGRGRRQAEGVGQQRRGRPGSLPNPARPRAHTDLDLRPLLWSATSQGSGFRCCLRHLRASLPAPSAQLQAETALLPAPPTRKVGKNGQVCGERWRGRLFIAYHLPDFT